MNLREYAKGYAIIREGENIFREDVYIHKILEFSCTFHMINNKKVGGTIFGTFRNLGIMGIFILNAIARFAIVSPIKEKAKNDQEKPYIKIYHPNKSKL